MIPIEEGIASVSLYNHIHEVDVPLNLNPCWILSQLFIVSCKLSVLQKAQDGLFAESGRVRIWSRKWSCYPPVLPSLNFRGMGIGEGRRHARKMTT
jgi:hypothetical protein